MKNAEQDCVDTDPPLLQGLPAGGQRSAGEQTAKTGDGTIESANRPCPCGSNYPAKSGQRESPGKRDGG
jgi:hypothetical protein